MALQLAHGLKPLRRRLGKAGRSRDLLGRFLGLAVCGLFKGEDARLEVAGEVGGHAAPDELLGEQFALVGEGAGKREPRLRVLVGRQAEPLFDPRYGR